MTRYIPTYTYAARAPLAGAEIAESQFAVRRRYVNDLIGIERRYRVLLEATQVAERKAKCANIQEGSGVPVPVLPPVGGGDVLSIIGGVSGMAGMGVVRMPAFPACYDAHPECVTCGSRGLTSAGQECPNCQGWGLNLCAECQEASAEALSCRQAIDALPAEQRKLINEQILLGTKGRQ